MKIMAFSFFVNHKFLVLRNFECILLLNSSFDGGLFLNFYFETTITFFLSSRFLFYV